MIQGAHSKPRVNVFSRIMDELAIADQSLLHFEIAAHIPGDLRKESGLHKQPEEKP